MSEAQQVPTYGIGELKKIFFFAVEAGNVADKLKDQKGWIGKAAAVLPLTDEFISLLSLDPSMAIKQFKELSSEEKDELISLVVEKYNIKDDEKEALVEEGLMLVGSLIDSAVQMTAYAKKWSKK